MEYHFVPPEERARDEKGNLLPWGYIYKEYAESPVCNLSRYTKKFHIASSWWPVFCGLDIFPFTCTTRVEKE
jgi:hypothetical protein